MRTAFLGETGVLTMREMEWKIVDTGKPERGPLSSPRLKKEAGNEKVVMGVG